MSDALTPGRYALGTRTSTLPTDPVSSVVHTRVMRVNAGVVPETAVPSATLAPSSPQIRKLRSAPNVFAFETLSVAIVPRPIVSRLPSFAVLTLRDCF
jgi:hypothetical protein